jgi:hypothetical protein
MLLRKRLTVFLAAAMMLTMMSAAPAFAHHCTNASKEAGAGSIGTYNVVTESFTPSKSGGGAFITFTDGSTFSYDVYQHHTLPDGALAAGPGGDDECDGQGIDDAFDCLGIPE